MRREHVYLALAAIGTALPYSAFLPWLREHGVDLSAFARDLFATPIGAFFGWDVIVSAAALFTFIAIEQRGTNRVPARGVWVAVAATLLVGVSAGLPLYLYLRERAGRNRSSA